MESDSERLVICVGMSIDDAQRELTVATLKALRFNKRATAVQLGISLKTLYTRLNAWGVHVPKYQRPAAPAEPVLCARCQRELAPAELASGDAA